VIALDLIVHRSSLDESLARFRRWVTQIFPPKPYRCLPHCHKLRDLFIWLVRDSKYDSRVLETVMQQAFGTTQRLFEASSHSWSGLRLAIMATMASTSQLCIFTNYSGRADHHRDPGELFSNGHHEDTLTVIQATDFSGPPRWPKNHWCGKCKSTCSSARCFTEALSVPASPWRRRGM